jgi:hypothetical protein
MWLAAASVLIFFPVVLCGAGWGAAAGAALGVLVFFAVIMPLNLYVTLRPGGVRAVAIAGLFLPAFLTGGISFLAAHGASFWLGRYSWGDVPQIVLVCLIGLTLYGVAIRKTDAQAWHELLERFRPMLKSLELKFYRVVPLISSPVEPPSSESSRP